MIHQHHLTMQILILMFMIVLSWTHVDGNTWCKTGVDCGSNLGFCIFTWQTNAWQVKGPTKGDHCSGPVTGKTGNCKDKQCILAGVSSNGDKTVGSACNLCDKGLRYCKSGLVCPATKPFCLFTWQTNAWQLKGSTANDHCSADLTGKTGNCKEKQCILAAESTDANKVPGTDCDDCDKGSAGTEMYCKTGIKCPAAKPFCLFTWQTDAWKLKGPTANDHCSADLTGKTGNCKGGKCILAAGSTDADKVPGADCDACSKGEETEEEKKTSAASTIGITSSLVIISLFYI